MEARSESCGLRCSDRPRARTQVTLNSKGHREYLAEASAYGMTDRSGSIQSPQLV